MNNVITKLAFSLLVCMMPTLGTNTLAQTVGSPQVQTVNIAAIYATGHSINVVEMNLPEGAIGYVVRFTTKNKGAQFGEVDLFSLLSNVPRKDIKLFSALSKFVISNSDGNNVDAYIFTSREEADNFRTANDVIPYHFYPCKEMTQTVSACFYSDECLARKIYFGFRNWNWMQGLDVKVEFIPIFS